MRHRALETRNIYLKYFNEGIIMDFETTSGTGIRYHHYLFAQHVMLNYVLNRPKQSLEMFGTGDNDFFAIKHLKTIWYQIYSQFKEIEKVDFEGMSYTVNKIDNQKTLIVFTLPMPQFRTESYFIGIFYQIIDENSEPEIRYFTLESHNENEAAFCELRQGQHTILDLSETLNNDEFINRIKEIVI